MKSILIVGHGLAGAILAHTLIDRGLRVTCTEGKINHSASRIAAGLINPFIGPKLNIPLDFQQCIEVIHIFSRNGKMSPMIFFLSLIPYLESLILNNKGLNGMSSQKIVNRRDSPSPFIQEKNWHNQKYKAFMVRAKPKPLD